MRKLALLSAAAVAAFAAFGGVGVRDSRASVVSCPVGPVLRGLDVSRFQGAIDWYAVASSGISFAYARADYGLVSDPTFQTNYAGIGAAGIARGAYLFFDPAQDPVAQADELVAALAGAGYGPGDLLPALDVEISGGLAPEAVVASLQTAVDTIAAALGAPPLVYSSPGLWQSLTQGTRGFGYDPLWVANWGVTCPSLPSGWTGWSAWQYADNGNVPGIPGAVDLDYAQAWRLPLDRAHRATIAVTASTSETTVGTPVTLTATVGGTDGGGTVTLWSAEGPVGGCTDVQIVAGRATCTTGLGVGTFVLRAVYSGDATTNPALAAISLRGDPLPTALAYVGPAAAPAGGATTLAFRLTADGAPLPKVPVEISVGGRDCLVDQGKGFQATPFTDANGVATCSVAAPTALGPAPVTGSYAGREAYLPSTATASLVVFAFPSAGAFVVGDAAGPRVTWWAASWWRENPSSGGVAPPAFKGFADTAAGCGGSWTTRIGSAPPATVPTYMGVVVASSFRRSRDTVAGDVARVVVVATNPGYGPDASAAGTGTVVATYC